MTSEKEGRMEGDKVGEEVIEEINENTTGVLASDCDGALVVKRVAQVAANFTVGLSSWIAPSV